jgi:hypothetical protein
LGEFYIGKRCNNSEHESFHIAVKLKISFREPVTRRTGQMALFDSDGEFGFAIGVFGGIGGSLEPEAVVEPS